MQIDELPEAHLVEAPWNPNALDATGLRKLRASLERFGLVQHLVVRPTGTDRFEVLSGNQRLRVLREAGVRSVPCVVVEMDDANARLLAHTLNRLHGEDDLGLRAELIREVLRDLPEAEVLSVLPESPEGLRALVSLDHETIADSLRAWQQAQSARLRHLTFQLTTAQLEVVTAALAKIEASSGNGGGDARKTQGSALYQLCKRYVEQQGGF